MVPEAIVLKKNPFLGRGIVLSGMCKFLLNDLCVGVAPTNYLAPGKVTLSIFFIGVSNY